MKLCCKESRDFLSILCLLLYFETAAQYQLIYENPLDSICRSGIKRLALSCSVIISDVVVL